MSTRTRRRNPIVAVAALIVLATVGVTFASARPGDAAGTERKLGSATYYDVMNAATAASSLCPEATPAALAATMLAPVWIEASAGAAGVPSPMAHSRWDTQPTLSYNAYESVYFWNPGIGIWQMDSAGLGQPFTSWQRVSTAVMAPVVAKYVAAKFCAAQGTVLDRAHAAWGWRPTLNKFTTWYACNFDALTACDQVFNLLYNGTPDLQNLILDTSVSSLGGMEPTTCALVATKQPITCFFMDFKKAQGTTSGYLNCTLCPTPEPRPYLSYASPEGQERRQFYRANGAPADVFGVRSFNQDARGGLIWFIGVDSSMQTSLDPIPLPNLANVVLPSVQ